MYGRPHPGECGNEIYDLARVDNRSDFMTLLRAVIDSRVRSEDVSNAMGIGVDAWSSYESPHIFHEFIPDFKAVSFNMYPIVIIKFTNVDWLFEVVGDNGGTIETTVEIMLRWPRKAQCSMEEEIYKINAIFRAAQVILREVRSDDDIYTRLGNDNMGALSREDQYYETIIQMNFTHSFNRSTFEIEANSSESD